MNPLAALELVPRWVLAAAVAALAVAAVALNMQVGATKLQLATSRTESANLRTDVADLKTAIADANALAATQTAELANQVLKAQNEAKIREGALRAAAAAALFESDGLRDDVTGLRDQLASASRDAIVERTTAIAVVLGQCAARYQVLAERGDRHVNDLRTMIDAWPKSPPAAGNLPR